MGGDKKEFHADLGYNSDEDDGGITFSKGKKKIKRFNFMNKTRLDPAKVESTFTKSEAFKNKKKRSNLKKQTHRKSKDDYFKEKRETRKGKMVIG